MAEYIDREQAIETFKKVLPITPRSCAKTNVYVRWILALSEAWNNIPSADVQPVVHGHWRKMNYDLGYECSECGWEVSNPWDFCPNCGARMDGGEDGS